MLNWKTAADGSLEGYCGEALIGVVRHQPGEPVRFDAAVGVAMVGIPRAQGEAASVTAAKRAAEKAWATWLRRARLQPIEVKMLPQPARGHSTPGPGNRA